jgi:hypothetical protein
MARGKGHAWEPEHPETSRAWISWRLVLEGRSIAEIETMTLCDQANMLEAMAVSADVRMWQASLRTSDG